MCPVPNCQDLQFARNTHCRRCGAPRPDGESGGGGEFQGGNFGGGGGGGGGGGYAQGGSGGGGGRREGGGRNQRAMPGDWMCPVPNCQDLQFARNTHCRRCGAPRPAALAVGARS